MKKCSLLSIKLSLIFSFGISLNVLATVQSIQQSPLQTDLKSLMNALNDNNQGIKISELQVEQSKEDLSLAKSMVYPRVNFISSYTNQDDGGGTLIRTNQRSSLLQLRQPIYQGGREYAGLDIAKFRIESTKESMHISRLEVSQLLIDLYYELSKQSELLRLNRELEKLSKERVDFLDKRVKIGRSRASELIAARAQLYSAESQIQSNEQMIAELENRIELLTRIKPPYQVQMVVKDWNLKDEKAYLASTEENPYLKKVSYDLQLAKIDIDNFKGNHKPTLDLSANYYFERVGVFNRAEWDLTINLTFPIFQGGQTVAEVKKSMLNERASIIEQEQMQNNLTTDIKNLYQSAQTGHSQSEKLKEAVALGLKNYQQTLKEYELSLVNNLEVIQAMNLYIQYKKDFLNSYYQSWSSLSKLEVLTGNN
jgi:outer membrane protein